MSLTLEELSTGTDHERVVFCRDPEAGYGAVIAIHSSVAGPAVEEILGWSEEKTSERIAGIYDTLLTVLRLARAEGIPPHVVADRLACERLSLAAKRRQQ